MTYCIVIDKELKTDVCPLPPGRCVWAHRQTHKCKYSESTESMSAAEIALLVGGVPPDPKEVSGIEQAIRQAAISELTE